MTPAEMVPERYYTVTYRTRLEGGRERTIRAQFLGLTEQGARYERLRLAQGKRYILLPSALVVSVRRKREVIAA